MDAIVGIAVVAIVVIAGIASETARLGVARATSPGAGQHACDDPRFMQLQPQLLPPLPESFHPLAAYEPVSYITAGHGPVLWRRMGDSNPRGLAPNTLSKRAP